MRVILKGAHKFLDFRVVGRVFLTFHNGVHELFTRCFGEFILSTEVRGRVAALVLQPHQRMDMGRPYKKLKLISEFGLCLEFSINQ